MPMICALLFALTLTSTTSALNPGRYHDYCIIGAGPSGLQLGHFLQKANRDYMIFERSNIPGHFFKDYPRHRTLISINKRHTGQTNKEFNMRHDWNSLLSDDESLLFTKYSQEMFPHADRLVDYMHDYHQKLGIKVQFNTEVSDIHTVRNHSAPDGLLHAFHDQHGNMHTCRALVLATGRWKPNIPDNIDGIEHAVGYENMSVDPSDYEGKSVLILGNGNTAFEVAQGMYGMTSLIHILSRSRVRLAWQTHYVGDLRAVNVALLDTYQLKSLDGILAGQDTSRLEIRQEGDKVTVRIRPDQGQDQDAKDNSAFREPYDKVIRCLGFVFDTSIFRNASGLENDTPLSKKFLPLNYNYEVKGMPGVFGAGVASHAVDYRKSSGGFIHGFRYTARALFRLLEWRYESVPWPSQSLPVTQLMNVLMKRMNEASGSYQMFQLLADTVILSEDGQTFHYLEEFPINLLHALPKHTGHSGSRVLVMVMQYGANFSGPGKDNLAAGQATDRPNMAHTSNFLHPVLYYYPTLPTEEQMKQLGEKEVLPRPSAIHHVVEDFLTLWDTHKVHGTPLRHFLEHILSTDLRQRFGQTCFLEALSHGRPSPACSNHYLQGQGLTATPPMALLSGLQFRRQY
ncbi:FAD-dependent oxidoreductase domain-containing protein 2-like [Babylonia areolata]|uniref:FAD-dependent oxidoreductase domain-containing protein 2-like n=1 Tax=Babylonia areolata TaxID=304850 RepID=UPI003FD0F1FD